MAALARSKFAKYVGVILVFRVTDHIRKSASRIPADPDQFLKQYTALAELVEEEPI